MGHRPRARAEGTTILLSTQYLDEADQLADGIAVIDHGRVIAEGTPGQLKASVGSGALHVRLLTRTSARRRRRSSPASSALVHLEPDPAALQVACADGRPRRRGRRRARPRRIGVAAFSLGQPSLDEVFLALTGHPAEDQRGGQAHDYRRPPCATRSPPPRARRARAPSRAALTFGWRGMLKVKHVPEQLLDVTITPVMFVLMFTYLFGGAISGSTAAYLDYILPGILVMSVLFTTVYSGVRSTPT